MVSPFPSFHAFWLIQTGAIPYDLTALKYLERFTVNNNHLTGEVPPFITCHGPQGKMAHYNIHLKGNRLVLPQDITGGVMHHLDCIMTVQLPNQGLRGKLPPDLGKLINLVSLDLSLNKLSGPIPPTLSHLTKLQELSLMGNRLTSTIPEGLGLLLNLRLLLLNNNRLSGPIPSSLGGLKNMKVLSLAENHLSGGIPVSFSGLTSLEDLSLYRNKLSGPIDKGISMLVKLQELKVSDTSHRPVIRTSLSSSSASIHRKTNTNVAVSIYSVYLSYSWTFLFISYHACVGALCCPPISFGIIA